MLTYDINTRGSETKTLFLYNKIKDDIISGKLKAYEKLPSKRQLAEHLSVSAITVENAYILLEEEGYISAKARSGFYVNRISVPEMNRIPKKEMQYLPEETEASVSGEKEPAYFPAMTKIMRRILSERPWILQQKPPHLGCAVLRNAIADYLRRYRNMDVLPSHIIIGAGSEYLYGLTVQLFGREVLYGIEDPSYEKIELVYRANGACIDHLKMGESGIISSELARTDAKVLHVTPYHSFPTGVTATAEKRYEYLSWAKERGGYIIEDDFDSEFAFYRKPIETLYAMDPEGRVVYMNTFTKSLSPAIRTAYMVLSDELLEQYKTGLGFYSCPVPVLDQYVLASFIESGAFERHMSRMRSANRTAEANQ